MISIYCDPSVCRQVLYRNPRGTHVCCGAALVLLLCCALGHVLRALMHDVLSSRHLALWVRVFIKRSGLSVVQMFTHQIPFYNPSNQNAVSGHHYSSSEGSEGYSFGAPATGDAFLSDGSTDSRIGSLAANDEPYLPSRNQDATTGNPSPLNYSVAPDHPYLPPQNPPTVSSTSSLTRLFSFS